MIPLLFYCKIKGNEGCEERSLLLQCVKFSLSRFLAAGVFFALLTALLPGAGVSEASNVSELKSIEEKLSSEKAKLKEIKRKEANALNSLYRVNSKLKKAEGSLKHTKEKIYYNKRKLAALSSEMGELEGELKQKGRTLADRISEVYKSGGGLNPLEILFSSKSIGDFLNRGYYFEKLISVDMDLIGDIQEKVRELSSVRRELGDALGDMRNLAEEIEVERGEIKAQAEAKKKIYSSLKARRVEYERRIAKLEETSKQIEGLINRETTGNKKTGATGKMMRPARGRLVSGFGYRRHPLWGGTHFHTGIDIGAPYGDPIKGADGGEIIFSGWWDGYGKAVVIDHGRGMSTVYGHMSRIYVRAGQHIEKGQIIGLVGSTGFSTGPHLHFEVRRGGKPVNPSGYLI